MVAGAPCWIVRLFFHLGILDRATSLPLRVLRHGIETQEADACLQTRNQGRGTGSCIQQAKMDHSYSPPLLLSTPVPNMPKLLSTLSLEEEAREAPASMSSPQVNLDTLPHPSHWDSHWVQCVRGFTRTDTALLHKQHLMRVSMLISPAQISGPDSPMGKRLEELQEHYGCISRHIMDLNPVALLERSGISMDSLEPIESPPADWCAA